VDPLGDLETLDLELILSDVATVDRQIEKVQGQAKAHPREFAEQLNWLAGLRAHLNAGRPAAGYEPAHHDAWLADFNPLSAKPSLYVVNVAEDCLPPADRQRGQSRPARHARVRPAWCYARPARPSW